MIFEKKTQQFVIPLTAKKSLFGKKAAFKIWLQSTPDTNLVFQNKAAVCIEKNSAGNLVDE